MNGLNVLKNQPSTIFICGQCGKETVTGKICSSNYFRDMVKTTKGNEIKIACGVFVCTNTEYWVKVTS